MDQPPYSVLMPLAPWEPPAQVAAALESLACQTFPATQVVVSCDGAPPAPLAEVLLAADLPLEVVVGPGGEGVGPVLTRGLHCCRQALVVRADADDISMQERCAVQVAEMAFRSDVVAMSSPILEFIKSPQYPCSQRDVPIGIDAIRRRSIWRNPMNHPAVIMRRDSVLAIGGYRDCPGFEDYDLWLRLLTRGRRLDNLSKPLVFARVGPDHLARRRGLGYVGKELQFLISCGCEGILNWPQVLLSASLRTPLRLVPAQWQQFLTSKFMHDLPGKSQIH
jgi:hypothetical protein